MNAETSTTTYRVALPEFEGPLDLLLHLCKTHEIEVVNLPISFITTKYLEYLEIMQTMPVDVAADYLVMAATLAYLKSRELVPAPEPLEAAQLGDGEDEDGLDPREELIRRLLEYQKYKDAAEKLGGRPIEGRNVFGRGAPVDADHLGPAVAADESVWKLIEAFGRILDKASKTPSKSHNVIVDRVSIGDRIHQLVDRLQGGGGSFRFESCFDMALPELELRNQVVVTLLAILELARLKVVRVLQADDQETLFITHIEGTDLEAARSVHVTSAQGGVDGDSDDGSEGESAGEGPALEAAPSGEAEPVAQKVDAGIDEDDVTDGEGAPLEDDGQGDEDDGDADSDADEATLGEATVGEATFEDEEAAADATLVEPAPAGVQDDAPDSDAPKLAERGEE